MPTSVYHTYYCCVLVTTSDFVEILRDAMRDLSITSPEVLCLGLGSPSCSRDARAQLAFLLSTCDSCDIVCTLSLTFACQNETSCDWHIGTQKGVTL